VTGTAADQPAATTADRSAGWALPGPAWLFCPADRPERYPKAAAVADVVILDLEDAVAPADKDGARRALVDNPLDPERTVIRVNPAGTADHEQDLQALAGTGYRRLMLAKCESAAHITALARYQVVALVESPAGALALPELAAASNTVGLMWGGEDLIAAMGGSSSRGSDGSYRDVVRQLRSNTLLAAAAYRRFALDGVFLDIPDTAGLEAESRDAVAIGYDVKVAIHPSQLPVIRAAYAPVEADVDWARRVLDAAVGHRGVFSFEGRMVDAPVLRHAERILGGARH
jgi:citrate lyase subunit beta/citryl-CoA lyase